MVAKATPTKKAPAKKSGSGERTRTLGVQNAQRTSARDWLARSRGGEDVEVPSGNVALLRRPGPEMFLTSGGIPDALTDIVGAAVREKQGLPPEKAAELANDPAMMPAMLDMVDAVLVAACLEPKVRPNPTCVVPKPYAVQREDPGSLCAETPGAKIHIDKKEDGYHKFVEGDRIEPDDRDPEFLYCSEVDFTDKMFVFQYAVGGTRDLERFREEYQQSLDGLHAVNDGPK